MNIRLEIASKLTPLAKPEILFVNDPYRLEQVCSPELLGDLPVDPPFEHWWASTKAGAIWYQLFERRSERGAVYIPQIDRYV